MTACVQGCCETDRYVSRYLGLCSSPTVEPVAPLAKCSCAEEFCARKYSLPVLRLSIAESAQFPLSPVEHDLVAIRLLWQHMQVQENPASLARTLQGEIGGRQGIDQGIDQRGQPQLPVEYEEFWPGLLSTVPLHQMVLTRGLTSESSVRLPICMALSRNRRARSYTKMPAATPELRT